VGVHRRGIEEGAHYCTLVDWVEAFCVNATATFNFIMIRVLQSTVEGEL
ncbi:LOW QUALITY PROTEIN: hypothetical protein TorRG33x02_151130, partial [Trema orientale]